MRSPEMTIAALQGIVNLARGDGWMVYLDPNTDTIRARSHGDPFSGEILALREELEDNRWGEILARVAFPVLTYDTRCADAAMKAQMFGDPNAYPHLTLSHPPAPAQVFVGHDPLGPLTFVPSTGSATWAPLVDRCGTPIGFVDAPPVPAPKPREPLAREPKDRNYACGDRWRSGR